MSAESGEGEHKDAPDGGEDGGVRFMRRARRYVCSSGGERWKSGPAGARTKVGGSTVRKSDDIGEERALYICTSIQLYIEKVADQ